MDAITKARMWWTVRRWWHLPDMMASAQSAREIAHEQYLWCLVDIRNRRYWNAVKRTPRRAWLIVKRLLWELAYRQPLSCNGNAGGWQTRFCEWLEAKARYWEDLAEYGEN
jgi:hypothetical protein